MKRSTHEWIERAEKDYQAALALARRRKITFHEEVCFHCQQSAEKYLKARLNEGSVLIPKTHDLKLLIGMCLIQEPAWSGLLTQVAPLSAHAVGTRYPGMKATAADAKKAIERARVMRKAARKALGV